MAPLTTKEVLQRVAEIADLVEASANGHASPETREIIREWLMLHKWWSTLQQVRFQVLFEGEGGESHIRECPESPSPVDTAMRSPVPPAAPQVQKTRGHSESDVAKNALTLESLPRITVDTTIEELQEECQIRGLNDWSNVSSLADLQRELRLGSIHLAAIPLMRDMKMKIREMDEERGRNYGRLAGWKKECQRRGLNASGTLEDLQKTIFTSLFDEMLVLVGTSEYKYMAEMERLSKFVFDQLPVTNTAAAVKRVADDLLGDDMPPLGIDGRQRQAPQAREEGVSQLVQMCFHDCPMSSTATVTVGGHPRSKRAKCQWNYCAAKPCSLSCTSCDWDICARCIPEAAALNEKRLFGSQVPHGPFTWPLFHSLAMFNFSFTLFLSFFAGDFVHRTITTAEHSKSFSCKQEQGENDEICRVERRSGDRE